MTPRQLQIVLRIQDGASVRDVAQEFGVTSGQVVLLVRRARGSFPEAAARTMIIRQRIQEGVPRAQIARELGIDRSLVDGAIRQALGRR